MYNRTTDGSNDNEAVKIVNSLKPFAKKWFDEWGRSCIRCKKMTVTTAPSNNVIGVTDAFSDREIFIPYMSVLSDAAVGDVVWCKWNFDNMQTLYADSIVGDMDNGGTVVPSSFDTLWTGSWSSGNITVPNIGDYPLFLVRMDGQGTEIIAGLVRTYFRGIGGYCASDTSETNYYISATLSGNTLTMVDCHSITQAGTRTARTVTEIIGVRGFGGGGGGSGSSVNPYNGNPQMDGIASAGSSDNYSRGDHVHPTDITRAPIVSPSFTGTPTSTTPSSGDDSTRIATTEFVNDAVNSARTTISSNTGTISTSQTSRSVSYSGTLLNFYATQNNIVVITDVEITSSSVTFSVESAPSSAVSCYVIYME